MFFSKQTATAAPLFLCVCVWDRSPQKRAFTSSSPKGRFSSLVPFSPRATLLLARSHTRARVSRTKRIRTAKRIPVLTAAAADRSLVTGGVSLRRPPVKRRLDAKKPRFARVPAGNTAGGQRFIFTHIKPVGLSVSVYDSDKQSGRTDFAPLTRSDACARHAGTGARFPPPEGHYNTKNDRRTYDRRYGSRREITGSETSVFSFFQSNIVTIFIKNISYRLCSRCFVVVFCLF